MPKNNKDFFKQKKDWSKIKDSLLGCYLPQYFQKVLHTGRPIYYVDCFAGKGRFDDGELGSPLIAMDIRNQRLTSSTASQARLPDAIKFCFIELNHAADLKKNVDSFQCIGGTPEIISGRFEDTIRKKLQDKQGYNVFLYVDPYGIKALDSGLFAELQGYGFNSFEMLINFNSFGFIRDACRVMKVEYDKDEAFQGLEELVEYSPTEFDISDAESIRKSEELLTAIAGGDYWKEIIRGYQRGDYDGYTAEKLFADGYRDYLKTKYKYVLDMPIRMKAEQRPKYRMIHVSQHPAACFLMADNMQRRKDELFFNIRNLQQPSLFDISPAFTSSTEGVVYSYNEIKQILKEYIRDCTEVTRYTKFVADFCNKHGLICDFKMMQEILVELETEGLISIIRDPAITTRGKKSTFWEDSDSKGKKLSIRRIAK